ncbi:DegP protease 7 isoform 2 [Hibiscus syriacus]|uniref:DegP protease 7 isoform 2 n=1 Tax=Hibiscus syriacus TaxID=106335 RepID=A0A6A2WAM9_HIBSY|nr:DegP protease 7 isoform 2 [Hibiscus syriacus]
MFQLKKYGAKVDQFVLVTIDRHEWYAHPQIYTRNDSSGLWTAKPAFQLEFMHPSSGVNVESTHIEHIHEDNHQGSTDVSSTGSKIKQVEEVSSGGVVADCSPNETAQEMLEDTIAKENAVLEIVKVQQQKLMLQLLNDMGLIAVDKNTVAVSACDVMLSFAAYPIEIPGEVVFLHPVHNYALVAYDPSVLGPVGVSAVRAAELLPGRPCITSWRFSYLVGLNRSLQATSRKSVVTNPCATMKIGSADCPRRVPTPCTLAVKKERVSHTLNTRHILRGNIRAFAPRVHFAPLRTLILILVVFSGVLADEHGRVQAIWASFQHSNSSEDHQFVRGIPVYAISQVLDNIISGGNGPHLLINGVKRPMPLVRILEVELYPTLLSKARSFGLSDDWIQALVKKDPVRRQGREIDLVVGTDVRDGNGTTRVINWCGCIVQDPHPAVRALGFLPEEGHGVYVAR